MSVAIITDSAAAMPPELVARHGITVVPMWLTVRGEPELEGERSLEELVTEDRVTTSAPTPGEFEASIKDALRAHDAAVVLTIASSMSATNASALIAAQSVGGDVRVIDTATAGVAGWAGRHLGINPLFEFREGKVHRLRPALSQEAALDRILAMVRRARPEGEARLHVAALHALAVDVAHDLLERVGELDPVTAFVGEFGPVMVVHTGPRLAGLAWWWESPSA
jgi:fatty acid-binding protein DegV